MSNDWARSLRTRIHISINVLFYLNLLLFSFESNAQVVYSEPSFPTQSQTITVFFDATQGNQGLKDFMGEVYWHAGVITNQSSSGNDWRHVQTNWGTADPNALMSREGPNLYSRTINVSDYFEIETGEIVEQLAFVFRNADGTVTGRDTDGSDIFLKIFPDNEGLQLELQKPLSSERFVALDDTLFIKVIANQEANFTINENEVRIGEGFGQELDTFLIAKNTGQNHININFATETSSKSIEFSYWVMDDRERMASPPGIRDGLNYYTDTSKIFQLFAPMKSFCFLLCESNNFQANEDFLMHKTPDGQRYWIELPDRLFDGNYGLYQYFVDGEITIGDPYSELILDPWNDHAIDTDYLSRLPSYPTHADGIITVFEKNKSDYDWTSSKDYELPNKTKLNIYEILLRDFSEKHNYHSLIDSLPYLKKLGINAIELMPIYEFEGNDSWGYNPSYHFAIDKYYGSADDLKRLIDHCHAEGMAVILDVVFNHAFSQSPLAQLYWDPVSFRPASNNPWLNTEARHPFNVGYDFNHNSSATKSWVKRGLEYWIKEFRFDGFRFDLSKGLTQTNSIGNIDRMGRYDASRIEILKDYADYIWSINEDCYVILEHFAENREEQELADYGMLLWGNNNHDFLEAAMGYSSNLRWANYQHRGWAVPHVVNYVESHDEERLMYKVYAFGNSNGDYYTRDMSTGLERAEAAQALFLAIPGPKLMWQFGEMGYDFSINRCENGTITNDCRLSKKPIRWDYLENKNRDKLSRLYQNMYQLRNHFETFHTKRFDLQDETSYVKSLYLHHDDMNAVIVANFNVIEEEIDLNFKTLGSWYDYTSGDTLMVVENEMKLALQPGEYRVYLDQIVTPPAGFTSLPRMDVEEEQLEEVQVLPVLVIVGEQITFNLPQSLTDQEIVIYDVQGRVIKRIENYDQSVYILETMDMKKGVYFFKINSLQLVSVNKFMIL